MGKTLIALAQDRRLYLEEAQLPNGCTELQTYLAAPVDRTRQVPRMKPHETNSLLQLLPDRAEMKNLTDLRQPPTPSVCTLASDMLTAELHAQPTMVACVPSAPRSS